MVVGADTLGTDEKADQGMPRWLVTNDNNKSTVPK
jgi:hypothetical protein